MTGVRIGNFMKSRKCETVLFAILLLGPLILFADATLSRAAKDKQEADVKRVAELDVQYQTAVKNNDVATIDHLLPDDFILVTNSGKTFTKSDLLEEARSGQYSYERQEDTDQTVRVWGDTAVVTAKLWAKGTHNGQPFEYRLWFSDTYTRTAAGWKYVFGQAAGRLP